MPLSPEILAGWVTDGVIRLNTGPDGFIHQPEKGPGLKSIPNAVNRMAFYGEQPPSPQELINGVIKRIEERGIPLKEVRCLITRNPLGRMTIVDFLHNEFFEEVIL